MKAIVTVGVSASGKSTWADSHVREMAVASQTWKKIERDCIRRSILIEKGVCHELQWDKWRFKWEKVVNSIQTEMIESAAGSRTNIIISDTNLNKDRRRWLINRLKGFGYDVEEKWFPITFEEAVARDNKRKNGVGYSIIAQQFKTLNAQTKDVVVPDANKQKAIIVDVDGTLAFTCDRSIYDAALAINDHPNVILKTIVNHLADDGYKVIIVTGRQQIHREVTIQWLDKNGIQYHTVYNRGEGDKRPDQVVKEEIFDTFIRQHYNVEVVFDDRPRVCRMWRSLGLKVLQCGDPHIEF